MPPKATNRRVEFIDTYRELVLELGERGATLDAVAKRAGASKGGLLHHFPSKAALIDALCERFTDLVAADIAGLPRSGLTAAQWYLQTSNDTRSPLERTMAALIRLAPTNEQTVHRVLRRAREQWFAMVLDDVGDESLARAVILLGDGIAYHIDTYGEKGSEFTSPETAARMLDYVAQLRRDDR
ncbi:TetR/AcrR family transcriptional regulator [Gulosibacter faecalis]|jgi:AcrR family transcriptional regulator|uniref:TetR/AcrR family transcriptional regulator n=1 Tax=Gulosibacter faecalis TaxID=272240 RepID=A0ABW5UWZ1_9MICO|nr:TetR/AcrR family transcriptional regulator [Gulosibacter faecalis]